MGTTNLDEGDRLEEDLAAIPDLIAGSLAETMTSLLKRYGKIPQVPVVLERHTTKAELISNWLFFSKRRLKKVTCLFEHVPPKQFRAGVFWLDGLDL